LSFADIVRKEKFLQERMHKENNNATVVGGSKMLQMQVSKAMDRDRRKCNLMIMGVAEGDNDDSGKDTVDLALKGLGVDKDCGVEYIGRIGNRGTPYKTSV